MEQIFDLWVNPELKRQGLALSRDEVTRVVVEMPAKGEELKVFLNEEAHVEATVVANRDLKAGEPVYLHDIEQLKIWAANVDDNSGWVCYARVAGREVVSYDLRPNKAKATGLIQKAREFLAVAKAVAKTSPDVAIDNAHSAAELTVQAQMLLLRNETNDHHVRRKWFSEWTQLENSPRHHSDLLFDLANRRSEARYGAERLALKPGRLAKILTIVQEMIDATAARIE